MTEYMIFITSYLRHRLFALCFLAIGVLWLVTGSIQFGYIRQTSPVQETRLLFDGIEYIQDVRTQPLRVAIHIVRIDLATPGLRFLVTPSSGGDNDDLPARTTSQFLEEFGLQLAINGDYFQPWRDYGLLNYYPHVGDPVSVQGLAASDGEIYTTGYAPPSSYSTLYLTPDNHAVFNTPPESIANAISGNFMLIENGVPVFFGDDERHPRTAVATDEAGRTLILIVVDGRQPWHSVGATLSELVEIVQHYGGYNALNLDGGGSATLVIEDEDSTPQILNSPIHNHIPGRERPVANHLGVYAEQLD
jgi:hypothetical protein